jgi:hypothetical protein
VITSCQEFRSLLERSLEGGLADGELARLSWHEHLLGCGECRHILEAEEALEILLATLPEPKLPPHLARRVVSRLRDARKVESRLDALLELDRADAAPDRLAASVLAGLREKRHELAETAAAEREARLDRLLDLDRGVAVPKGLAQRVLAGLESERTTTARVSASGVNASTGLARQRSRWVYAAAAGVLAFLLGWLAWPRAQHENVVRDDALAGADVKKPHARGVDAPPDAQMLAALDVLEQWDLLRSEDVDVLLSSSIEPVDEALLEYQEFENAAPAAPAATDKEPEPRSKG